MAGPKHFPRRSLGGKGGNFVPTVKLDASRVTDMRAQTGPRMLMRMQIRSQGGLQSRQHARLGVMRPAAPRRINR